MKSQSSVVAVAAMPHPFESVRAIPVVKEDSTQLPATFALWNATAPGLASTVEAALARGCRELAKTDDTESGLAGATPAWRQTEFVLSFCTDPIVTPDQFVERYQEVADANFTLVASGEN